ncbi:hypothetical protein D3C81_1628820 [compost metagenome]
MMIDKKKEWEVFLHNKQIEWTLIRLPFVIDRPGKNVTKENLTDMPGTSITNQDIASFISNQINSLKYVHKAPFISN